MAYDFTLTEEQEALITTARDFTRKEIIPVAGHYDESGEFPREILKKAWQTGLMNVEVPEEYGGLGGSCIDHCLVQEEVAYGCLGFNTSLAANMLGAMPLMIAGTDEQKKEWLPRLVDGGEFAAYCCSEPDAGSDVAGMTTRVKKDGDDYLITGQKRWITNGGVAGWYSVLATFDRGMKHKGIACFVVDAKSPGLKVGRKEDKMGQRASNTCDVIFEDVRVPKRNLLGAEDGGFKVAMKTFDRSRPWIAAGAAGVIRRALDESRNYALERKTFGVPIAQHQAIQFILAEMAIAYETTRLLTHKAAWMVDRGDLSSIVSAYAKGYGADAAMRCTTDAVQVFGGYGYTKEYPVEKLMRDAKLLQIYEGTSQIQRVVIARNILGALMDLLTAIGWALGIVLIAYGLLERARIARAAPPDVNIKSAPIGTFVRIVGQIVDGGTLVAPISGRACVSFDAVILEDGSPGAVVTRGLRGTPFIVDDGTGKILVDPRGAYVHVVYDKSEDGPLDRAKVADPDLLEPIRDRSGHFRYDEGVLTIGERVAVTGLVSRAGSADDDPVYRRLAPTELRLAGAPDRPAVVSERPEDL